MRRDTRDIGWRRSATVAFACLRASPSRGSDARYDEVQHPGRIRRPDHRFAGETVDITLSHLGGLLNILVHSWMGGSVDSGGSERRRPDAVIDGIGELLDSL
jgi:hypothetical protein